MDILSTIAPALPKYLAFLFAMCFHEAAHAWMAKKKGDNTAELMGRLSMNPMAHIDWLGTVIFPLIAFLFPSGFLFGWAKPVPVNVRNLRQPKDDMFWVALAGPASNIILALIGTVLLGLTAHAFYGGIYYKLVVSFFQFFILINLFLAFFNLLPIHPLDGGKILERFLPYNANRWIHQNNGTILMVFFILMFTGQLRYLFAPLYQLNEALLGISSLIANALS